MRKYKFLCLLLAFISVMITGCEMAVSYTHLDVYKRQGQSAMAGFYTKGHFYGLSFGSTSLGIRQTQVPCSGVFQTYIHSRAYMLHNTCDRLCYRCV